MQAAYHDAAATTRLNERHWSHAQGGNINRLVNADLATLRRRARYEILNNSYGAGIADTLAMDLVGSGPRPQLDSGNEAFDQECEELFMIWSQTCDYDGQCDLAELLQMQLAHQPCEAGESITLLKTDTAVRRGVRLRLLAVDIDRLGGSTYDTGTQDGITFNAEGRPVVYHVAKHHPNSGTATLETDAIAAADVIHFYRKKRPGQTRGIPWYAPCLELFAQMRRFTLATLDAAETAADVAGLLEAHGVEPDPDVESMDVLDLERKALLVAPSGYTMNQMKAEHPATTYAMFKGEILNEIARCVMMPYNVAAMNSARYNYASGRLDHQKYHRFIETLRALAAAKVLRRIFAAWVEEAFLRNLFTTRPSFEQVVRSIETLRWFWPGFKHVDPVREANAEKTRLIDTGTLTLEDCVAEQGKDWKRMLEQTAKEKAFKRELEDKYNLSPGTLDPTSAGGLTPQERDDDDTPQPNAQTDD